MTAEFDWDHRKAAKNITKHRVSFDEAKSVFSDPEFITVVDAEHSIDEERYITIGLSGKGRLLILAHTDREGIIRIISARKATKREEKFYENSEC
jgi:uncharacterized protein